MSLLLSFFFTSLSAQACPQLSGNYSCISDNSLPKKITVEQSEEEGVSVFKIINEEKSRENLFDLLFIADGVKRKQTKPIIDRDTGRIFALVKLTSNSFCPDSTRLHYNLNMDIDLFEDGMMYQYSSGKIQLISSSSFDVKTSDVITYTDGSKAIKETLLSCVLTN